MKRGKDEEKLMGPMFPRLHVNDSDKGGPKAPPRNKMALYEQLSIPSQRFSHSVLPLNSNNTAAKLEPPSSQGVADERGMFFSYQPPTRHQSEMLCSQYSDFSIPLTQVEQRKKLDEDDFRVPIFIHSVQSQECGKYANDLDREKVSPSNPSYLNRPLKFHKFKKIGMLESSTRQEGKSRKEENSKEFATGQVKAISSSTIEKAEGLKKRPDSSVCHEPRDSPAYSIDRLKNHDIVEPELCANSQNTTERCITSVLGENVAALDKRNSSASVRASPSEDQKIFHDLRNDTESQDRSFRSVPMRNLERGDSMSETSVMDSISRLDVTPDDVVGIIGQKHFWKARTAIVNQQRVFAVQVFELHRLIKVQRSIAESPQLLVDDSGYLGKPTKILPGAKNPLNCPVKPIPNVSKQKGEPEKPSQKKESSAENTVGKASFSSNQNGVPPSSCRPLTSNDSPAPSVSSNRNAWPLCFNQPQGHQWLIPVMSPSEGLVYKPYPGPGFVGPACSGCGPPPRPNSVMGSFLTPAYGVPAPHPQYQLPSFPPAGPHRYFPTYGMPIMNAAAFSGSSVEQMNPPGEANVDIQHRNLSTTPSHKNRASPEALNGPGDGPGDVEVQASTASSPVDGLQDSRRSSPTEGTNVLPLFPMAPAIDAPNCSPRRPEPERPMQVIKVVPHNPTSATESAARIFRSIQEERKQYDSV